MSDDVFHYQPAESALSYRFGRVPSVAGVQPWRLLRIDTWDCYGGRVTSVEDLPSEVCEFPNLNPVSGPIDVNASAPATRSLSTSCP